MRSGFFSFWEPRRVLEAFGSKAQESLSARHFRVLRAMSESGAYFSDLSPGQLMSGVDLPRDVPRFNYPTKILIESRQIVRSAVSGQSAIGQSLIPTFTPLDGTVKALRWFDMDVVNQGKVPKHLRLDVTGFFEKTKQITFYAHRLAREENVIITDEWNRLLITPTINLIADKAGWRFGLSSPATDQFWSILPQLGFTYDLSQVGAETMTPHPILANEDILQLKMLADLGTDEVIHRSSVGRSIPFVQELRPLVR